MPRHRTGSIRAISCPGRIAGAPGRSRQAWIAWTGFKSATVEAEQTTQLMSVARDQLVPALDHDGCKRKATNQCQWREHRQGGRDPKAGSAAAHPAAVQVTDMQGHGQLLLAGCVGHDRCCLLKRQEGQPTIGVKPLQDHRAAGTESAIRVEQDHKRRWIRAHREGDRLKTSGSTAARMAASVSSTLPEPSTTRYRSGSAAAKAR